MKRASVFADNELTSWADAHAEVGGYGGFEFTVNGVLNFARAVEAATKYRVASMQKTWLTADAVFESLKDENRALRDEIRRLVCEPAATEHERDAARYRFLRAADHIPISAKAARDPVAYDAAIDAAMAAGLKQ